MVNAHHALKDALNAKMERIARNVMKDITLMDHHAQKNAQHPNILHKMAFVTNVTNHAQNAQDHKRTNVSHAVQIS